MVRGISILIHATDRGKSTPHRLYSLCTTRYTPAKIILISVSRPIADVFVAKPLMLETSKAGNSVNKPWDIYDRLIDGVPESLTVDSYLIGTTWTLVEAEGMGMAMTYKGGAPDGKPTPSRRGEPLRELAQSLRSWSLPEASLGMAAVNAYHNQPEVISGWVNKPLEELVSPGAFVAMLPEMAGKKVAVIGHFPGLETVAEVAELTILERNPSPWRSARFRRRVRAPPTGLRSHHRHDHHQQDASPPACSCGKPMCAGVGPASPSRPGGSTMAWTFSQEQSFWTRSACGRAAPRARTGRFLTGRDDDQHPPGRPAPDGRVGGSGTCFAGQ